MAWRTTRRFNKTPFKILISTQAHHAVTAMLLLVSLRGNGAYDDLTIVLGGYGEASTVLLCVADTFKQRPRLQKAYPRANRAARYAFALAFLVLRVGYWSWWIVPWTTGPPPVRLGLYALLGLRRRSSSNWIR